MSTCAACAHWDGTDDKPIGLCLSPRARMDGRTTFITAADGGRHDLPIGITLHREMMGAKDGANCTGYEAKP